MTLKTNYKMLKTCFKWYCCTMGIPICGFKNVIKIFYRKKKQTCFVFSEKIFYSVYEKLVFTLGFLKVFSLARMFSL